MSGNFLRNWFFDLPRNSRKNNVGIILITVGLLLLNGCMQFRPSQVLPSGSSKPSGIVQVSYPAQTPQNPPPEKVQLPVPQTQTNPSQQAKVIPINLDTVLRLAQDQNGQVKIARVKLDEAFANKEIADKVWLPDIFVGFSYFRHEGGIQDETGRFIHSSFGSLFGGLELNGRLDLQEAVYKKVVAEQQIWRQRGEISKLKSETLLDATSTYVDLLAAKTGEAIARQTTKRLDKLLKKAEALAKIDPGIRVEVARVQTQVMAQKQILRQLEAGFTKASAKLAHLLGIDPNALLVPMDAKLVPFNLVGPEVPVEHLVAEAMTNGPGIREIQGLLALINQTQERSQGLGRFLPVLELRMAEGAFGAGAGSAMDWDNRLDVALQARWNLKNYFTAQSRKRAAMAKMQQAHLNYDYIQSKLTLGVQEATQSIQSNLDQMEFGKKQISHAESAFKLSEYRLNKTIKGSSPSEVLLAIRTLMLAQMAYLNAVRDFDKAQLRVFILTGKAWTCDCRN